MKNKTPLLMAAIVGLALLGVFLSEKANAYTVGITEVGSLDTLVASGPKKGSPDSEALWVQGQLGDPTIDWTVSIQNVAYSETSTIGIWAFALTGEPEYWLMKNSNMMALFTNVADLNYGVFDASILPSGLNVPTDPWSISHVTELNKKGGGTVKDTNVPEPALFLLMLFGLGIFGFTRVGKRPSS